MSPHPRRLSSRVSWWWLPVFLGVLVGYAILVIVLVRDGIPVALAITVPPAILGAASATVVFLRNFLTQPHPAHHETAPDTDAEHEAAGS